MQYMMVIYESPADAAQRDDPAKAGAYWGSWTAYAQALGQGA